MNTIIQGGLCLAIGLALAGPAAAKVEGRCTYEDHMLDLEDGAAWIPLPDEDEDTEEPEDWDGDGEPDPPPQKLSIGFGSFALDAGALARAKDREEGLSDQAFADEGDNSGKLVLSLEDGEVVMLAAWFAPGTTLSRSGSDIGKVTLTPGGDGTVAGKYHYVDEDDGFTCDATFSVAKLGDPADAPPPPGTPLPRGGGEPGQAYLALNQALRAGDVEALRGLMAPAQVAEMEAARKTPEFDAQLAMMKTMAPTDVVITGGRIDGDRAWVEFTAVEFGNPRVGTADMRQVDGRWTIEKESTRDP